MLSHTALSEEENVAWSEKDLGNVTQTEHVNENIDSTSNYILMKPSPVGGKQVEPVAKAMKDFNSLGETSLRNCSINSSMGSNLVEIVVDP